MERTLLVSTRKGLFALAREGAAWRIARTSFRTVLASLMLCDSRHDMQQEAVCLWHIRRCDLDSGF